MGMEGWALGRGIDASGGGVIYDCECWMKDKAGAVNNVSIYPSIAA